METAGRDQNRRGSLRAGTRGTRGATALFVVAALATAAACGPKAAASPSSTPEHYDPEVYGTTPTATPAPAATADAPTYSIPAGAGWYCFATNAIDTATGDSLRASFCMRASATCSTKRDGWRKGMSNPKFKVTATGCVHADSASCFTGLDADGDPSFVCSQNEADCRGNRDGLFSEWKTKTECKTVN